MWSMNGTLEVVQCTTYMTTFYGTAGQEAITVIQT